ncbi:hypothetical protein OEZ85_005926 [Tetradesmus obliquus]|uniref:Uncharacterized protein n=1 Tax=Tetradesmus obliquus TaxID=3088 RepID=A0ABY8UF20_TETOB|nr:hypothetical protein OEZ85_005926 [Tetradesmus obliquus]
MNTDGSSGIDSSDDIDNSSSNGGSSSSSSESGAEDEEADDSEAEEEMTELHRACKLGLLQQVQELLDEGQSVNLATPGAQLTPLHIASKHGKVDVVHA